MSDTVITDLPQVQNDTNTNVRVAACTIVGNLPPPRVKKAVLIITNAQIASQGMLYVMLGGACSVPLYINSPGSLTMSIDVYDGDGGSEYLELNDFSLSQPLTGGSIVLLTVS